MIVDGSTLAGALYVKLRERIKLKKTDGLFLYCGNLLVMYSTQLRTLYETKREPDGFVYIKYAETNPF